MGWNPEAKCIASKSENFDVKHLRPGDFLRPCLVVFDCLMLNGEVLSKKSLRERIGVMEGDIFGEVEEGRCMMAERKEMSTKEEVIEALNNAIEMREEGIVIKRPDSTYKMNTKSFEGGWLKIKPDYVDKTCDDLDLLIVGGYFGKGRTKNLLSHFLLALAEPPEQAGADPTKFVTVCKVGSGYSMKELYDLNVGLNNSARLFRVENKKKVPDWLKMTTERPEVYIEPKNSKIVQVRAAEITSSNSYGVGYTLRFPRVERIRTDKSWRDCMTTEEFHTMRVDTEGKLARKLDPEDPGPSPPKRRRGAEGPNPLDPKPTLAANNRMPDLTGLKRKTNAFGGKELVVVNAVPGGVERDKLVKGVVEMGGKVVSKPGPKTFCVVAGKRNVPVNNLIQTENYNVVKGEWLERCLERRKLLPWVPQDMWFATKKAEEEFSAEFDQFGDSYTQSVSVNQLKTVLKAVKDKGTRALSPDTMAEFEMEYFPDYKYGMFRRYRFYMDKYLIVNDTNAKIDTSPLDLAALEVKLYGGTVVECAEEATHIVTHSSDRSRLHQFDRLNRERERKIHIVNCEWVRDCLRSEKSLNELNYRPV